MVVEDFRMSIWDEDREDESRMEYAEEIAEERAARRGRRCQCGDDLPGHCPGPRNCPYSDFNQDDDE
jgi:hypothetical protein